MVEGIIIGMVLGGLLIGFFSAFGKDLYNSVKNKLISKYGKARLTDTDLKKETLTLYMHIMIFLRERAKNDPEIDFDNWKESTNNLIQYSRETMNLYDEEFGPRIVFIRQEYLKRGIKSDRLDRFHEHPTNPLGIREIAYGLAELAGKLGPA